MEYDHEIVTFWFWQCWSYSPMKEDGFNEHIQILHPDPSQVKEEQRYLCRKETGIRWIVELGGVVLTT